MSEKKEGMKTFINRLPSKGRFRFFLLFIFISFLFWISTKLSNTYTLEQTFNVVWSNIPDDIVMLDNPHKINASVTASGIEIIIYRLFKSEINISLINADFSSSIGKVNIRNQKFLIQQQLFENTLINQINPISFNIYYSRLDEKMIVVVPKAQINLRAGYLRNESLSSLPDSISVIGPKSILDSLKYIETVPFKAKDVFETFSKKVNLKSIPNLKFGSKKVTLKLSISRYSEKEFTLPIKIVNLPSGVRVKLFPPNAKARVTMPVSILNNVKVSDFSLEVDYNTTKTDKIKELNLYMHRQPPGVKQIIWEPKQVNYLIRK